MVMWNNPGKGVASSPTSQYSSYWKESLDYGRQLTIINETDKICKEPSLNFKTTRLTKTKSQITVVNIKTKKENLKLAQVLIASGKV